MGAESDKQQPWKIRIHAKSKYFNFKFKANNIVPTWKFIPFSVNLNLRHSLLKVKSEPQVPFPRKRNSFRILPKFQPRPTKNKAIPTSNYEHPKANFPVNYSRHFGYEEPICISSIVAGFLALLFQSISQKEQKGITILYSLIILLYLALIFKKFLTKRTRIILAILFIVIVSCTVGIYPSNISKFREGYISNCLWQAWNFAASFGQVVLSSFSQDMGAHRGDNYLG
ncbi:hypothetical protein F0562_017833 [Nyssa sinensis]|uniref:Uncharacterized protein n=1 Tax=Nyssa sinensis TaxID=561372 RepID=A0A5J4ZJU7_9ASTE|nr:hypothetical protein F0562_017833 [Nyssa sinensis]